MYIATKLHVHAIKAEVSNELVFFETLLRNNISLQILQKPTHIYVLSLVPASNIFPIYIFGQT